MFVRVLGTALIRVLPCLISPSNAQHHENTRLGFSEVKYFELERGMVSTIKDRITLSPEDLKTRVWNQDGLHFSHPLTPLFASYMIPALTEGTRLAMTTLKAPIRQFISKVHQGYFYQAVISAEGDPEAIQDEHVKVVQPLLGHLRENLANEVEDVLWPLHEEIDERARQVATADDALIALSRLQSIYFTFWEAHFRLVLPRMTAGFGFEAAFHDAFPDKNSTDAYGLLVGEMNKSLESDRALWMLAQEAVRIPGVRDALENADNIMEALVNDPTAAPFLESLKSYLQVYGWRTVYAHEFVHPTWVEEPNYCLAVIRGYAREAFDFDQHWTQVIRERDEKFQALFEEIHDPELAARFRDTYQIALEAWPLDEDHHFYIDAMLPAKARQLLLRVGEILVANGHLKSPDDICFLYLDEAQLLLEGQAMPGVVDVVAERRRDHERQATAVPEPQLGLTPDESGPIDPIAQLIFGSGSPGLEGAQHEVRGFAASPGRYVGPVKIVRGPEEFFKVLPGDILVCRSTAPSWTGLFAVAGAVITETGGILSHASTVAREYGIPCVVGTREATRVFSDGDRVMVDGSEGLAVINE